MKVFFGILTAFLVATTAMAGESIVCENGKIEEVGDRYFMIEITPNGDINVNPYESFYSVKSQNVKKSKHVDNTKGGGKSSDMLYFYDVENTAVTISSEGDEWIEVVDFQLAVSEDFKAATFAGGFEAIHMVCK